jgi:PAS domain S-box-containing protein
MDHPLDLESFVQAAGDAIIAAEPAGAIVLWNPGAQRIFGFAPEEAVGQSLDIIIPERFRERHWQGFKEVMATGQTRYGSEVLRVPAVHKDGRSLSVAFTVALLLSKDGKVDAIVAIVRDETARWNEERSLRKRLSELEQLDKNNRER